MQLAGPLKPLPVAFPYKQPVLALAVDFPDISQRFTNPKQAVSGLPVPCISCLMTPFSWQQDSVHSLASSGNLPGQHK